MGKLTVVGFEWIIRSLSDLTPLRLAFTWDDQQSSLITVLVAVVVVGVDATTDMIVRKEVIDVRLHLTMRKVTVPVAVGMIGHAHGLTLLVCKTMMRSFGREKFDTKTRKKQRELSWVNKNRTHKKSKEKNDDTGNNKSIG